MHRARMAGLGYAIAATVTASLSRIGLGGAFVAKIGYFAGPSAPFLASPGISVRRHHIRHKSRTFISPNAHSLRAAPAAKLTQAPPKGKRAHLPAAPHFQRCLAQHGLDLARTQN
ncbi:hypothetical protein [Erythrobacter sp.]|uniref:hypothetical protein n=1 Tax=Erythrobacter sp. TaxID=1042 RepID=UPI0025D21AEF|nr:hypothetical protein [Erythrobacter sp.]